MCSNIVPVAINSDFPASYDSNSRVDLQSLYSSTEYILITNHQTAERKQASSPEVSSHCANCLRHALRKKTLYKRLPILQWLPKYSRSDAIGDLIAGVTVGLMIIPQGLAYANVAGLPIQFGLYSAIMGSFMYVLFGTCKDNTVGPTAIASLMTYQIAKGVWQRAVLLTFLTGIIEILMAIFQLGFLVDFVSGPVSAGFTSAAALIVVTSQVKHILGVQSKGATFLQHWLTMLGDIENIRIYDAILGCCCIIILITLRLIGRLKITAKNQKDLTSCQRYVNKLLWFVGVSRNIVLVITCTAICGYLEQQGKHYFTITGYVPPGLPEIGLPAFSIAAVQANATAGIDAIKGETFMEMIHGLGYSLITVPLVALLEYIAIVKTFAKGKPIDAKQELLATGIANVANSFFKGYRANGGLTRASINNASGVRTQMANLYIGLIVLLALLYVSAYFYFIPKTVLAAIIISAIIFQVQYQVIQPMWRSKRSDLIPGFFTFIACLVLPLEIGILIAIAVNLLFILYHSARPKVTVETLKFAETQQFLKITPDRCLIFPSIEFVRNLVLKSGHKTALPVVIDCTYIYGADYTAAKVISAMIQDFTARHQKIIFFNLKPSVVQIFEGLHTKLVLCYNYEALIQELGQANRNEATENYSNSSTTTLA